MELEKFESSIYFEGQLMQIIFLTILSHRQWETSIPSLALFEYFFDAIEKNF